MKYLKLIFCVIFAYCCLSSVNAAAPLSSKRLELIDKINASAIEGGAIAGSSVLVSSGSEIVKFDQYGSMDNQEKPMSEDTIFRLYSMTKPITVVAALILHERDYFMLDDEITQLWPELGEVRYYVSGEGDNIQTAVDSPTVRELMMHTSGLFYPWGDHPVKKAMQATQFPQYDASISDMAKQIMQYPLLFKPGKRWEYGYSTDVLAGLVEYLAKEPFDVFIQREILDPLGMVDTSYVVAPEKLNRFMDCFKFDEQGKLIVIDSAADSTFAKPNPVPAGGTGLTGTITDYWRFCRMLLQRGVFEGKRILSPKSVDFMLMNQMPNDLIAYEPDPETPYYRFSKGYGFGLGVKVLKNTAQLENVGSVGEAGWSGAASTYFWLVPEHDLVILWFTQNRSYVKTQTLAERNRLAVYHSILD